MAPSASSLRTRREVLIGGMAGAFSLALASCGASTIKKATSVKPASEDLGAVEHVVFLMNENRSFDHYYGSYRGVRGFADPDRDQRRLRPGMAGVRWKGTRFDSPSVSSRHQVERRGVHVRPVARLECPAHVLEQRCDGQLREDTHLSPIRGPG